MLRDKASFAETTVLDGDKHLSSFAQELHLQKKEVGYSDVVKRNKAVVCSFSQAPRSFLDVIRYRKVFKTKREYFFYDQKHTVAEKVRILCRRRLRDCFMNLPKRILTRLYKLFK